MAAASEWFINQGNYLSDVKPYLAKNFEILQTKIDLSGSNLDAGINEVYYQDVCKNVVYLNTNS
jgi:hypothetical protein